MFDPDADVRELELYEDGPDDDAGFHERVTLPEIVIDDDDDTIIDRRPSRLAFFVEAARRVFGGAWRAAWGAP